MDYWTNRKVLVTGGAGMIGSHLVEKLATLGADVYVADNLWRSSSKHNLEQYVLPIIGPERYSNVDLQNPESCLQVTEGMDTVFHLADIVGGIQYATKNEWKLYGINTTIDKNVLEAAKEKSVREFIYASSVCAYPMELQQLNSKPLVEDWILLFSGKPHTKYGEAKRDTMKLIEQERGNFDNAKILMLHNVYGPRCDLHPDTAQFIPHKCRDIIEATDGKIPVWGGEQRRAFLYVEDAVEALIAIAEKGQNEGFIQAGPPESTSIDDVTERLIEISGKSELEIEHIQSNTLVGDVDRKANPEKAKRVLDWEPKTSLDEGLRKTYEWCLEYLTGDQNVRRCNYARNRS